MSADGTEYLDFTAGIAVVNTGHCHPRVVAAIREQAARFIHSQVNCYRNPILESLAQRLAGVCPAGIDRFFFSNSGAEAVEAAVKLAKAATGRTNVVVFEGGFHGRTHMAMAMTTSKAAYRAGYQPLPAGVFVAPFPRPFEWGCDENEANRRALAALEKVFTQATAPHETAAVVIEPVLGEGGYLPAAAEFMRGVAGLCRSHEVLLVLDEVQTGFGRTGKFWALEHSGVEPDVIVMAKGFGSGFPISAIGARAALMDRWPAGSHGGTYGGNPLGAAAVLATLDVIEDEALVQNSAERGVQLMTALHKMRAEHAVLGDVRGLGLMVGCELVGAEDGSPDPVRARAVVDHCRHESRVLFMTCGTAGNVIRWMPPLVVSPEEIDRGLQAFAAALDATG
ncbi:MAG: aspartate aminotransferase family protein [Acidimicrobiia bacterium]|nr:aspartate aminotransferase family protein [Acidimicrobiia bacterium]